MAAGKYSNWFQWSEYETKTSLKQKKNMIAKGGKKVKKINVMRSVGAAERLNIVCTLKN